jgi:fluoride exporter
MNWSLFAVGLGGAIGAIGRYAVLEWLGGVGDGVLPWGTFVANIVGSLLLGGVTALVARQTLGESARLFLGVGLLGGFTTSSFFSYENLELLRDDRYLALLVNSLGQLMLGLLAAITGFRIVKMRGDS